MKASSPCLRHSGIAATNSRVFLSGSHTPVSGWVQRPRVSGFRSSKIPWTMRELNRRPSMRRSFHVLPS